MASSVVLDPAALDAARRLVAIARARYPVVEAWLYGSHARGEAHEESDIDVAIVLDMSREQARTAGRDLAGEAFDVLLQTNQLVSPTGLSVADWSAPEGFSNPFFLRNIRRDGIAV